MAGYHDKIEYAKESKRHIKESLKRKGVNISDDDSFRSYADKIDAMEVAAPLEGDVISYTFLNAPGDFSGARNIKYLNIAENRTSFKNLFKEMFYLRTFELSNSIDTSQITDMSYMFYSCSGLDSVDFGNMNTSNVTNMSYMFSYCNGLDYLDVSTFDTSNVTNMSYMAYNCIFIESLDLSNFDTSNVTNMYYMLRGCNKLRDVTFGNNWASNKSITLFEIPNSPLSKESILDLANKLADKSDTSIYTGTQTVTLKSSQQSLFTEEELTALANQFTSKNWTLTWS